MKRSSLIFLNLFICCAVGVSAAGCEFDFSAPPALANRCITDVDCFSGICAIGDGICISPTSDALEIVLAITPATDELGGLPLTTVDTFVLTGPDARDIRLDAPVLIHGTVRDADGINPVEADLHFEPVNSDYDETLLRGFMAATTQGTQASSEFMGDYAARLVGERTYRVRVIPAGEDAYVHAPIERSITTPQADPEGLGVSNFNIAFPPADSYRQFWGRIVTSSAPGEYVGVGDLTVRAVSPGSGETVSSMAITSPRGDDLGEFRIFVPEGVEDYHIRVTNQQGSSSQHTIIIDPSYLHYDDPGPVMVLIQQPRIVEFEGRVETSDEVPRPVSQASITLYARSLTREGEVVLGTSRVNTITDESGVFHARLLEGEYTIVITPRASDELSVGLEQRTVMVPESGRPLQGQVFPLKPRTIVRGRVLMNESTVFPGAAVEARAHDIAGLVDRLSGVGHHRTDTTTSNEGGHFALSLDDGSYDLIAHPSAESGLPWVVVPGIEIGDQHMDVPEAEYHFAAPVPITGRVTLGVMAQSGAEIRAFALIDGRDGAERTVQIGRAVSDEAGSYQLLLPPSLLAR